VTLPSIAPGSDLEKEVVRGYLSGLTLAQVSEVLGFSQGVLLRVLIRNRVPRRHRGYPAFCDDGLNYHQRAYRKLREDPDRRKADTDVRYFRAVRQKYGLSKEKYEELLVLQGGRCAICDEVPPKRLRVDHCHRTGKVRGLLCDLCNSGIGKLRDDPERLTRAVEYLQTNPADQLDD
jgi:hypothetical protein